MNPAFYPAVSYGGTVESCYKISKELVKRKHNVTVYTSNTIDRYNKITYKFLTIYGINVYYFRNISNFLAWNRFIFNPEMVYHLNAYLKSFEIIHLHNYRNFQNIVAHHYAKKYRIPYILQAHGSLPRISQKTKLKKVFDYNFGYDILHDASKVIALTKSEVNSYRSMGVAKDKISIIPNGINLSDFKNIKINGHFREKYNIKFNTKIILFIGRINKIKGLDILIEAYNYAIKKLHLKNTLLVIVGPDDGYLNQLKSLINIKNLTNNVLLTGPLYNFDKIEIYREADFIVLPSRYETFPNVILEAYAFSKPVIASNVESISDIIINGKTGVLFPSEDIIKLAESLETMVNSSEDVKTMGCNAFNHVKLNYSIDKVIDSIEMIYKEILY